MPDFIRMVATLREQMQADLSRSDVLRVLLWPIAILVVALLSASTAHAPSWVLVGLGGFICLFLLIYALSFIFLLFADRDALRSEKYSLNKLAIERGLFGDSTSGLRMIEGVLADEVEKVEAATAIGPRHD